MKEAEQIDDAKFQSTVVKGKKLSVVIFWTLWDSASRVSMPTFEQAAGSNADKLAFYKFLVGGGEATPGTLDVRAFPTVMLFKDGQVIDFLRGAFTGSRLDKLIANA